MKTENEQTVSFVSFIYSVRINMTQKGNDYYF